MMPIMAAGGFAGYSYYNQPPAYPQSACTVLTTNIVTTTYQPQVANLQRYFVNQGYLRGNPNGYFDQPTMMAVERFQADYGIPVSGRIDSRTSTMIQQVTCGAGYGGSYNPNYGGGYSYPPSYSNPPAYPGAYGQLSMQSVSAPRTLAVGQTGSFSVRVAGYTQGGGALRYSVVWGDENYGANSASSYYGAPSVQSSGTFTHVYRYPGTYRPVFTVTDSYGHQVQGSASVTVTGASYAYPSNPGCTSYYGNCSGGAYPSSNGYPAGCTGYYDRACYANGVYMGPGNAYNGYSASYPNAYPNTYSNGYAPAAYGYPSGTMDYSCYYDRACLAQMNGTVY